VGEEHVLVESGVVHARREQRNTRVGSFSWGQFPQCVQGKTPVVFYIKYSEARYSRRRLVFTALRFAIM
jgi:hypothetical protein